MDVNNSANGKKEKETVILKTRILDNSADISKQIIHLAETSSDLSIASVTGGMQLIYNNFFDVYKNVLDAYRKGSGKGVKWVLSIDKESLHLIKIFLDLGMQIKHVKNMPSMNFGVGDKEVNATIEKMEGGKMVQSLLTSNEPMYVQHYRSIFEELWKTGIDAKERIKEIEQGEGRGNESEDIEIIQDSSITQQLYLNMLKSATKEIMAIFPTINTFIRQEKLGAMLLCNDVATERNLKVRILMPIDNICLEKQVIIEQQMKQHSPADDHIDVRHIEQLPGVDNNATFLVVDRKASLVMQIKDDSKTAFDEAIGQSTYSNSKIAVLSYVVIFENLWSQSQLYQQIKQAHEQLKINDKMQKEFINIAAHELRNPIQPILGLTEVLRSVKKEESKKQQQDALFDAIIRNAKRLHRLTEDILDATKIESQSLQINKEQFELNEIITNAIADYQNQLKNQPHKEKNIKMVLLPPYEYIYVEGDKSRLTQVVSNLLRNALNFTEKGVISISTEIKKEYSRDDNNNNNNNNKKKRQEVIVSIKDTGRGIDPNILPRLFSKFATTSPKGTGLGLYISKSIIEAHGCRIWAENNKDGKGATFAFSLPLSKQQQQQQIILSDNKVDSTDQ